MQQQDELTTLTVGPCTETSLMRVDFACPQVDPKAGLNIKRDKNHVLFSGTKVLQHNGDKSARIRTPDNGCLAVVLRTGFETSQGDALATSALLLRKPFV